MVEREQERILWIVLGIVGILLVLSGLYLIGDSHKESVHIEPARMWTESWSDDGELFWGIALLVLGIGVFGLLTWRIIKNLSKKSKSY